MSKQSVLMFIGPDCPENTINSAVEMANRNALHLSLVVLKITPAIYVYGTPVPYTDMSYVTAWNAQMAEANKAVEEKVQHLEKLVQDAGISADISSEHCELSIMRQQVQRRMQVVDLVVIAADSGLDAEVEKTVTDTAVFESPVALLHGWKAAPVLVDNSKVLIGWDSSLPAANAVHQSLPFVASAEEIIIVTVDPVTYEYRDGEEPGADLATWLARLGHNVTIRQIPSGGKEISDCLLEEAKANNAGLIVTGAYYHSKLQQFILGGTTRSMLEQDEIPVLMSH